MNPSLKKGLTALLLASSTTVFTGCAALGRMALTSQIHGHTSHLPEGKQVVTQDLEAVVKKASLEKIRYGGRTLHVLHVRGTPYEMGYQHGRLLKNQIQKFLPYFVGFGEYGIKKKSESFFDLEKDLSPLENLELAYKKMEPFISPEYKEEMQGIADGSGVDAKIVHLAHILPEVAENACSNIVFPPSVTENNHTLQVRILDWFLQAKAQKFPTLIVYHPETGNEYAIFSTAGFVGCITGMNEKGVGVGQMTGGPQENEYLTGKPMPFLLRDVLKNSSTAEEAVKIAELPADQRTNAYFYVFGDKSGKGIGVYASRDAFHVSLPGEDYPHMSGRGAVKKDRSAKGIPQIIYGGGTGNSIYETLSNLQNEKVNVEKIMEWNKSFAMTDNLNCVIMDITSLEAWFAVAKKNKKACYQDYVYINIQKEFDEY